MNLTKMLFSPFILPSAVELSRRRLDDPFLDEGSCIGMTIGGFISTGFITMLGGSFALKAAGCEPKQAYTIAAIATLGGMLTNIASGIYEYSKIKSRISNLSKEELARYRDTHWDL